MPTMPCSNPTFLPDPPLRKERRVPGFNLTGSWRCGSSVMWRDALGCIWRDSGCQRWLTMGQLIRSFDVGMLSVTTRPS